MNGRAELGNLSGWSYSGLSQVSTSVGRHFRLEANAYMQQSVPSVLFTRPSATYKITIEYRRAVAKDPLSILTDTFATVRFRYESGKEDNITIPLSGYDTQWREAMVYYSHMDSEVLEAIIFEVATKDCVGGMLLDNMQLQPDDNILTREEAPENNYEKFREKSILYGLEANLPELG